MFARRSALDYPSSIFSVSFVFLNSLLFCLISTVLWGGATSICDGIIEMQCIALCSSPLGYKLGTSCEMGKTGMSEHLNRNRIDFSKECTNDELDAWVLSKLCSTENLSNWLSVVLAF